MATKYKYKECYPIYLVSVKIIIGNKVSVDRIVVLDKFDTD